MKKLLLTATVFLLTLALVAGCSYPQTELPIDTEPSGAATEHTTESTTIPSTESNPTETEDDVEYEGDASSYYIDVVYARQIERYYTALSEKWDEEKYFDNGLSALPSYYYEGNPLENVGFGFVDLDNDGHLELIIGAILGAEMDPAVFEIWTLVDGEPVMLAQGGSRNRYVLQYAEEDRMWYVVNEASNSAFNHATYYLMLNEGKFEVIQGIVFDAFADEENPWFMTYDMDWDVSNDTPIDEDTANAVMNAGRNTYAAQEYFPYSLYK